MPGRGPSPGPARPARAGSARRGCRPGRWLRRRGSRWPPALRCGGLPSTGAIPVHSFPRALVSGPCGGDGRRVPTTLELGSLGEHVAATYLTDAGLRVLDRNWRCREGELDIVAREGNALVFCEVKTRRGIGFGHPVEAVTAGKQRRLRVLAHRWLAAHDEHAPELRFDVVGVLVRPARPALVTHLRAAFA